MSHSAQPRILAFVRHQGWLTPEDMDTYKLMREIGISAYRLHERYIPLLKLAIGKRNIRGRIRPFREIENEFQDRLGEAWTNKYGKATLSKGKIVLTCPPSPGARKAIDKVEARVREWAARWGLSLGTEFSETGSKFRYTASYSWSANLQPMIPFETEPVNAISVDLGFTRIEITFDVRRMVPAFSRGELSGRNEVGAAGTPHHMLRVLVKAADTWQPVHTASFVDDTIGDINQMVGLVSELANRSRAE